MYRIRPQASVVILACICLPARAATAPSDTDSTTQIQQMQAQIRQLQAEVAVLKANRKKPANSLPKKKALIPGVVNGKKIDRSLKITGGAVVEYVLADHATRDRRNGGDLIFDYFDLGASGNAGYGITYSVDYKWSTVNFVDGQYLNHGWAAYDFGAGGGHQIKGGFFQVPFGNLPFGYESSYAAARYYLGLNDGQAAGLGYAYQGQRWRLDLAGFKNDDLDQNSTYGANPAGGYQRINGGVMRLAYDIGSSDDGRSLGVSASARGGQLAIGDDDTGGSIDRLGTHRELALAASANVGPWELLGQVDDYRYHVPRQSALPTSAVTFESYGFTYQVPARGQLYSFSLARNIATDLGPLTNIALYDDIDYLDIGGAYADASGGADGMTTHDTIFSVAGVRADMGPVALYGEWISARNGALGFNGPDDNHWHNRLNVTAAFYFDGELPKRRPPLK